MSVQEFRPINEFGQIDADELHRMAAFLEAAFRSNVGAGDVQIQGSHGELTIPQAPQMIWCKTTGAAAADAEYPYEEVVEVTPKTEPPTFTTKANGYTSSILPLFEYHGSTGIEEDTVVRAWLSDDRTHLLFDAFNTDGFTTIEVITKICPILGTTLDSVDGGEWS